MGGLKNLQELNQSWAALKKWNISFLPNLVNALRNVRAASVKILAISDIHGNIEPVHRLRALERNTFDAILVAGDIGYDLASTIEVFRILDSFACPILYVYGNWDHGLDYDYRFSENTHHLHNGCFCLDGFVFAGFSGIPENWGANPWVVRVKNAILARQSIPMGQIYSQIAVEKEELSQLLAERDGTSAELRENLLLQIKSKRQRLNILRGKQKRLNDAHSREVIDSFWEIAAANRKELIERLTPYQKDKVIVTTHGRLTNTNQDMPEVPLFLFGHRHGYSNTRIKRSRFVNVSALDNVVAVMPESYTKRIWKDMKAADIGTYTIIEINKGGEIRAASYPLRIMPLGWTRVPGVSFGFARRLSSLAQANVKRTSDQ